MLERHARDDQHDRHRQHDERAADEQARALDPLGEVVEPPAREQRQRQGRDHGEPRVVGRREARQRGHQVEHARQPDHDRQRDGGRRGDRDALARRPRITAQAASISGSAPT